jgi:hypothetical protein
MEKEVFIELKNHPGYFVSNMGRFRRGNTKILATPISTKGYPVFSVSQDGKRKYYMAHRLIAEHFIGSVEGKEINHKNFNKADNRAENLEIVTHSENMRHYHTDERANETYKKISVSKTKEPQEKVKSIRAKKERVKTDEKRKRAPGGGRKRTGGLQPTGALAKLPPIWVDAETLTFLRSLDNLSEFVRLAIREKRERS